MPVEKERKYKAGIDKDDCRKNRSENKVQLRKASKEEGLQKRRNMAMAPSAEIVVEDEAATGASAQASVPVLAQAVMGFVQQNGPHELAEQCLDAVVQLRKLLSLPVKPPIDEVIATGAIPALVMLLGHPMSKMQFEAAWCLTNVASGTSEQCQAVISHNGVPPLVALIGAESLEVAEQAVWALGNIAGDSPRLRDLVLEHSVAAPLLAFVEKMAQEGRMNPLRNAVWALSNLVRGKPHVVFEKVQTVVPMLVRLLAIEDAEVRPTCGCPWRAWGHAQGAGCGRHV